MMRVSFVQINKHFNNGEILPRKIAAAFIFSSLKLDKAVADLTSCTSTNL